MKRVAVLVIAAVGALAAAGAGVAIADVVPGGSYHAYLPGGGELRFTVTPDGTLVDSYRVDGFDAGSCQFNSEGDPSGWPGAPINSGAFSYSFHESGPQLENDFAFSGAFGDSGSATGRLRIAEMTKVGQCDSTVVCWTATAVGTPPPAGPCPVAPPPGTVTSPPGDPSTGPSAPYGPAPGTPVQGHVGTGAGPGPKPKKKPSVSTHVSFGKLSARWLGGHVRTSNRSCRVARTIILWRGRQRIATTHTARDGSYRIRRTARLKHQRLRAAVTARTLRTVVCAAGSSPRINV